MIVDAENAILGRLASRIAKMLLKGENVIVINAEKAIVTGNPKAVFERFREKRARGDPKKGPFYPRYPDRILWRAVRGMLPYKKDKGRKALKRLRVYIGNPEGLKGEKIGKSLKDIRCKYVTLEEVCKKLGAKLG